MKRFPASAPIFRVAKHPTHNTLLRPGEEVEFYGFSTIASEPFRVYPHPHGQRAGVGDANNYTCAAATDLVPLTAAARELLENSPWAAAEEVES